VHARACLRNADGVVAQNNECGMAAKGLEHALCAGIVVVIAEYGDHTQAAFELTEDREVQVQLRLCVVGDVACDADQIRVEPVHLRHERRQLRGGHVRPNVDVAQLHNAKRWSGGWPGVQRNAEELYAKLALAERVAVSEQGGDSDNSQPARCTLVDRAGS
jgi:hypothetical protein